MPVIRSKNQNKLHDKNTICRTETQNNFVNKFLYKFWFDCRIMNLFHKSLTENSDFLHLEDSIQFYNEWKDYVKNLLKCKNAKEFTGNLLIYDVVKDSAEQIADLIFDFDSIVDIDDPLSLHLIYSYIDDLIPKINGHNFYGQLNFFNIDFPKSLSLPHFRMDINELLESILKNYPRRIKFLQKVKRKYQAVAKLHKLALWDDLSEEKRSDVIKSVRISSYKRNGKIEFLGQIHGEKESLIINQILIQPNENLTLHKLKSKNRIRREIIDNSNMIFTPTSNISNSSYFLGNDQIYDSNSLQQGNYSLAFFMTGGLILVLIAFLIFVSVRCSGKIKSFFQKKIKNFNQEERSLNNNSSLVGPRDERA